MKPVVQTKIHIPGEQDGNCFAACVASLFEVELDSVPNFVEFQGPLGWWDAARAWCRECGYDIARIEKLNDVMLWSDCPPGDHALATIRSPRGDWLHTVVIDREGVVVHDPYPDAPVGYEPDEIIELELITAPYEPYPTQPVDLR